MSMTAASQPSSEARDVRGKLPQPRGDMSIAHRRRPSKSTCGRALIQLNLVQLTVRSHDVTVLVTSLRRSLSLEFCPDSYGRYKSAAPALDNRPFGPDCSYPFGAAIVDAINHAVSTTSSPGSGKESSGLPSGPTITVQDDVVMLTAGASRSRMT